jgi:hypothetical protein
MSSFVIINAKGDIKQGKIPDDITDNIENELAKALKRAKAPSFIGSWNWQKYKLFLYGYREGRAGTENKHDFHTPHNEVVLYGDALIIASLDMITKKPCPFTVENYKKFYNSKEENDTQDKDDGDDIGDEDDDDDEEDVEEEEEEYDDDDVDDEDGGENYEILDDDDEEEIRPMLRIKSSTGFKKIAKWMYSPELTPDEYVL